MDDDLLSPLNTDLTSAAPKVEDRTQVDPKLLTRALNKMRGLIKGNGLQTDKITLIDVPEHTDVKMYRFPARASVKLVPQYGTRTEPGRNTAAELIASEGDFKNAINQIAIEARTNPQKRKNIVDFMFERADKGFGIKDQRTKFNSLSRDLVQHDKCTNCANTGRITCAKCHGKALMPCPKCMGRKHVLCPRCRGDGKMNTSKGSMQCQFCRGDGRVNCKTCGARGQVKCQACAAMGTTACRVCAASGWISHLTHVELFAQISFDFDRRNLPLTLVQAIEKNPSRCVEKHDLEVTIIKSGITDNIFGDASSQASNVHDHEPDDTIWIEYDAMSPFGPIAFKLDQEPVAGYLFGFQARLLDFPFFMDKLIALGKDALTQASTERKNIRSYLVKAAKYRLIADIIAQTLWIKNTVKTKKFLSEKYPTGLHPNTISELVDLTDLTLRNITRMWRSIGLVIGFVIFAIILEIYFISNGREDLKSLGLPEMVMTILDILLFPVGIVLGVFGSKFAAKLSQDKMLDKIVPSDVLKKTLPKAGKTVQWSMVISGVLMAVFLGLEVANEGPIPAWLNALVSLTLSAIRAS